MPCHHNLETYLATYIACGGITSAAPTPTISSRTSASSAAAKSLASLVPASTNVTRKSEFNLLGYIEDNAMLIDGTPEIVLYSSDSDKHFVHDAMIINRGQIRHHGGVASKRYCQSDDELRNFFFAADSACASTSPRLRTLSEHAPNSHRPRHPGSGMNEMLPRRPLKTNRKARDLTEPHHVTARGHSPALFANLDLHHPGAAVAVGERDATERLHRMMRDGVTGTVAERPEHRAELVFVHACVERRAAHRTGGRRRDWDRRHRDHLSR